MLVKTHLVGDDSQNVRARAAQHTLFDHRESLWYVYVPKVCVGLIVCLAFSRLK